MKVETIAHPSDSNGIIRMYYRVTQRVPAASGAPVELIAMHAQRIAAIRELIDQLQEYQYAVNHKTQ